MLFYIVQNIWKIFETYVKQTRTFGFGTVLKNICFFL